jgi:hypothetical protein
MVVRYASATGPLLDQLKARLPQVRRRMLSARQTRPPEASRVLLLSASPAQTYLADLPARAGSVYERMAALEALLGNDAALLPDAADADTAEEAAVWDGPLPTAADVAAAAAAAPPPPASAPADVATPAPAVLPAPAATLAAAAAAAAPDGARAPLAGGVSKSSGFLARPGYDFPSLIGRAVELQRADSGRWARARVLRFANDTRLLTLAFVGGGAEGEDVDVDEAARRGTLNVLL